MTSKETGNKQKSSKKCKKEKQKKHEIEELRKESDKLISEIENRDKKINELNDRLLRVLAEFENFKKRTQREKENSIRFGNENILGELLPVLDHFESALKSIRNDSQSENILTGIEMIYRELLRTLKAQGLDPIEDTEVEFDSNVHDAVSIKEPEGDSEEGRIAEVLRKGYRYKGKLLRPASVVVYKKPPE